MLSLEFREKKALEMFSEKMCSFPRIFILYVHLLSCPQCFPILYFYLQYLLMEEVGGEEKQYMVLRALSKGTVIGQWKMFNHRDKEIKLR